MNSREDFPLREREVFAAEVARINGGVLRPRPTEEVCVDIRDRHEGTARKVFREGTSPKLRRLARTWHQEVGCPGRLGAGRRAGSRTARRAERPVAEEARAR